MIIVNREHAQIINTAHGSEIRPLIDRTSSGITQCSLAEEILPPGHSVRPHHHRRTEEIYYIVAGQGVITVGKERRDVGPGDAVYIPLEHRHTLENTGAEPMRIILVCGPAFSHDDEIFDEQI